MLNESFDLVANLGLEALKHAVPRELVLPHLARRLHEGVLQRSETPHLPVQHHMPELSFPTYLAGH